MSLCFQLDLWCHKIYIVENATLTFISEPFVFSVKLVIPPHYN